MGIGPMEITLIILVLVLLFGAKKLPELARGSGRALRIFKAETKGLLDEDDKESGESRDSAADDRDRTDGQRQIDPPRAETIRYEQPSAHPESER